VSDLLTQCFFQRTPTSGPPPPQESSSLTDAPDVRVGFGFKHAYVVFERPSGVHNSMRKMDVSKPRVLSTASNPIEVGLNKWRQEYNDSICLDLERLSQTIEKAVGELDLQKEEVKKKAEQELADADEEGWVTVSRHTTR
jgi:hypothetical protein